MTHRLVKGGKLMLYGPVGGSFFGDEGFADTDVIAALEEMSGDITVHINSGGGIAMQGSAIYNALKRHEGEVTCIVDGIAASAASVIAMAGDKIEMPLGSLMMIHEPAGITMGPADEHRKTAEVLDTMTSVFMALYADRTGLPEAEIAQMMKEETWLSPALAVEKGFATAEVAGDAATADASFNYGSYKNAPEQLKALAKDRAEKGAVMVSVATAPIIPPVVLERNITMSKALEGVAPVDTTAATLAVNPPADQSAAIFDRCKAAKLSMEETSAVMAAASGSLEKAKDAILDTIVNRDATMGAVTAPSATVIADARDRFKQGVELSLLSKSGVGKGEANEFTTMTLRELARESLAHQGVKVSMFKDPMVMLAAALGQRQAMMAAGMHSTSDFVEILANVANKGMLKGFDELPETFEQWTSRGSLSDFKEVKRLDLNLFPSLSEVPEGAEYKFGTMGERAIGVALATYGKKFAITRQAIINDDMNMFSKVPMKMGQAAKRTVGDLVYAVLTANAALPDGIALFHADHDNLAAVNAAPTAATLSLAKTNMALQTDPEGRAVGGLNIRPKYLLVPLQLEVAAKQVIGAEYDDDSNKQQRKPNPVRNSFDVISEGRLSTASSTAWYLMADQNIHDTIEVSYLNGNSSPMMEQRDGWEVDGVEFKIRLDAGVTPLDFRAMYKNIGA